MKKVYVKLMSVLLVLTMLFGTLPVIGFAGDSNAMKEVTPLNPYIYLNAEKSTEIIKMSGVSYYDAILFRMGYNGLSNGYTGEVNYSLKGKYDTMSFDAGFVSGEQRNADFTIKVDGKIVVSKNIKFTDVAKNFKFDVSGAKRVTVMFVTNGYDRTYYAIGNVKMYSDETIEEEKPLVSNTVAPYLMTNAQKVDSEFSMGGYKYASGYNLRMGYTGNSTGGTSQLVFNFQGKVDYMSFDICHYGESIRYNRDCVMKITVDDKVIYDSETIYWNDIPKRYTINLAGANQVIIFTESQGYDGVNYRIANVKANKCEHEWDIPFDGGVACKICNKEYFFKFGEDNIGFSNASHGTTDISWKGYMYANPFLIDLSSYIGEKITSNNEYNGACFGFATMNAAFHNGMSTSDFGGNTAYELTNNQKLSDAINLMLASQVSFTKIFLNSMDGFTNLSASYTEKKYVEALKKIVEYAENVKEGDFLPILLFDNHAVNIIGMLPDYDDGYYIILLNDSNNIKYPSLLGIKKDFSSAYFSMIEPDESKPNTLTMKNTKKVNAITGLVTNRLYNIDWYAPGLRTDFLGLYNISVNSNRASSEINVTESSMSNEDVQYRKENVMFLVDDKSEMTITSSTGKTISLKNGKIINSTFKNTVFLPVFGTDLVKIIVENDGAIYKSTSETAFFLYINNNGQIGVVNCDAGADVIYSTKDKITLNPKGKTVNYSISFYEEGIVNGSKAVGVKTNSKTNTPVTIDCSKDSVTINRKEAKSQILTICEYNEGLTERRYNLSKYADSKVSANASGTSYMISEGESSSIESVEISDMSVTYKQVLTILPNVKMSGDCEYIVTYESSNDNVAAVNENGEIVAKGTGSAEIKCVVTDEFGNTVEDTCTVKVAYEWWQWLIIIILFGWIWY